MCAVALSQGTGPSLCCYLVPERHSSWQSGVGMLDNLDVIIDPLVLTAVVATAGQNHAHLLIRVAGMRSCRTTSPARINSN